MKNKRILVFNTHTVLQGRALWIWWDLVAYPCFSRFELIRRVKSWAYAFNISEGNIFYRNS